jgi:hypothetical protein
MNTFFTLERYLTERIDRGRTPDEILKKVDRIIVVCSKGIESVDFDPSERIVASNEHVLSLLREFYEPFGCTINSSSEVTRVKGTFEITDGNNIIAVGTINLPRRQKGVCIQLLAVAREKQVCYRQ